MKEKGDVSFSYVTDMVGRIEISGRESYLLYFQSTTFGEVLRLGAMDFN